MRSKQYFTSIKNNPHEISTDPKNIVVDKIKQTNVYFSMIIFTDIHLCLLLVCRVVFIIS